MATSSAYLCCPATSATGKKHIFPNGSAGFLVFRGPRLSNRLVTRKSVIRADLDSMVSDMSTNGKVYPLPYLNFHPMLCIEEILDYSLRY